MQGTLKYLINPEHRAVLKKNSVLDTVDVHVRQHMHKALITHHSAPFRSDDSSLQ